MGGAGDAFERWLAQSDSDGDCDAAGAAGERGGSRLDAIDAALRAEAAATAEEEERAARRARRRARRERLAAHDARLAAAGDTRTREEQIVDIVLERLVKNLEVTYERPLACALHALDCVVEAAVEAGELELAVTRALEEDRAVRAELEAAGAFDDHRWQKGVRSLAIADGKLYGTAGADALDALLAEGSLM